MRPPKPTFAKLRLGEPFPDIEIAYIKWGDPGAGEIAVCVHGLTRNARDFDSLARALAKRGVHVLAVDIVGRGRSSWLADPAGYQIPNYAAHIAALLNQLDIPEVTWIGTSMGGLVGMVLAAQDQTPVRRLILNDVGPFIPEAALKQIQSYLGLDLSFASIEELEQHLRLIHAGFGDLSNKEWRHLAVHSGRRTPEGWRLHYDPDIRVPYGNMAEGDVHMWELWDKIRRPTYVLHGADSPILTHETTERMEQSGPKARVHHLPGVGHAPALMSKDQIAVIARWLEGE